MHRRFLILTLMAVCAGEAQAHRLYAECRYLPGRMVHVETWFSGTKGETPKKGHVQVRGTDGQVLLDGQLNRNGTFEFEAPEGKSLLVIVEAGEGHRAEIPIRPEQVIGAASTEKGGSTAPAASSDPVAPRSHDEPFPIKDLLTGIGLLLAVAAFVLSIRNARALSRAASFRP